MYDNDDDYGYTKGRCPCGRITWSDTSIFDCGCGAGEALAAEMDAQELEPPEDLPEPPAQDEPPEYSLRLDGERIPAPNAHVAEPFRSILNRISREVVS